ncbi:acyl-CoA dehydrogenase family member 11-like [Physella acuta]|uniref:acyl-CoA dehydrogenase family member 11-like n=1 Tax=Physella acuta TaxID=109671 RepID=UPI0027DCB759|nr:acyl-CoA dehydrogenase family member 11-like [Physella acuta]XP_059155975.1 acyl-CoA dehydrogenase family member 11-like [Physella acuta]XP_059155976.1 acyl-CoA dehydrogenase family member 11-like [Physella acuta]XP_059155977.1 acyl-CoA dehydrogenase family member 11-like [Physella acuta]
MLTCKNKLFFIRPSICGLFHGSAPLSFNSADTSNLVSMRKNENIEVSGASLEKLTQSSMPFASAKIGNFFQSGPELKNQYTQDSLLKSYLRHHVPDKHFSIINADLERFGDRVAGELYNLSLRMEAEQPKLEQTNAWGMRVDKLITSTAWQRMKEIAAEEGLVACGYERKFGEWSRLYQIAKFFLFEPSGGLYGCPLAMTNGAAKTLEVLKEQCRPVYERAFHRLTSRDSKRVWTSGQWMTEKKGGSDVAGGTETVAIKQTDGSYKLYGYKWFSSATDADVALTLARVLDANGAVVEGTRGLSLFYLELRDEHGAMNNIQMLKLKNKLGTKQLPTAELLIDGAQAIKLSDDGRGVASMSHMLTLTRIHTAMGAASAMRRICNLAKDYAMKRKAFGRNLHSQPLHVHTLAEMEVETRGATIFVLELARLLGRQEVSSSSLQLEEESEVLRLIVPLAKLYVSKQSVAVVSEGLECFGGQGYIEDTDLPRILRDTQVNAIWEGTTNILSLDVLRAIMKSSGSVLKCYKKNVLKNLETGRNNSALMPQIKTLEESLDKVLAYSSKLSRVYLEMASRDLAYSLAAIYIGALLVNHASHPDATSSDIYTAQRWCEKDLAALCSKDDNKHFTNTAEMENVSLVFDGCYHQSNL